MAAKLRFDGKVVIVTGGGGGLGRLYALEFGKRGAKVVVNDLGGSVKGEGSDSSAASLVAAEIKREGGEAVPDFNSVENGDLIVQTAIKAYGRIDVVVNNAGILRDKSFQNMSDDDWDLVQKVHLKGTFKVSRAAFPYMRQQNYGRIINVASAAGIYGNFGQSNYGAAKLGIVGLTHNLAIEGATKNIKVNVIAPLAISRMTEPLWPAEMKELMKPEFITPVVIYLAHESCTDSGGTWECAAGWVARLRYQRSKGAVFDVSKGFTAEDVQKGWGKINDFTEFEYPTPQNQVASVISQVTAVASGKKVTSGAAGGAAAAPKKNLKSTPYFKLIEAAVAREGAELTRKVNGTVQWDITDAEKKVVARYAIDLKNAPGKFIHGTIDKPSMSLTISDDDFSALAEGKLNPQNAFMQGKIKIKGSMALAMKLSVILDAAKPKSKL